MGDSKSNDNGNNGEVIFHWKFLIGIENYGIRLKNVKAGVYSKMSLQNIAA